MWADMQTALRGNYERAASRESIGVQRRLDAHRVFIKRSAFHLIMTYSIKGDMFNPTDKIYSPV